MLLRSTWLQQVMNWRHSRPPGTHSTRLNKHSVLCMDKRQHGVLWIRSHLHGTWLQVA